VPPPSLHDEDGRIRSARAALVRLPDRDRLLLALRAQGLSYRDIASAAAIQPASVGRLLARAVDRWASASGLPGANERQGVSEYELPKRRTTPGAR
jgi:DNA-directed RNA polymerase specialized sigma24 family protein